MVSRAGCVIVVTPHVAKSKTAGDEPVAKPMGSTFFVPDSGCGGTDLNEGVRVHHGCIS